MIMSWNLKNMQSIWGCLHCNGTWYNGERKSPGPNAAQDDLDVQNENVESIIADGNAANMIPFETGSVLNGGNGMEHMASFNYAYKLSAVRDWLFEQSK